MSIGLMNKVIKSGQLTGHDYMLLLMLANAASDEGYCWPSINTLAKQVRLNVRSTQKHMRRLEDAGLVIRLYRQNQSTIYRLDLSSLPDDPVPGVPTDTPVPIDTPLVSLQTPPGVPTDTPPVSPGTPRTINRTIIEPSKNPLARASTTSARHPAAQAATPQESTNKAGSYEGFVRAHEPLHVEALKHFPEPQTRIEWGKWCKAIAALRDAEVKPQQIPLALDAWRRMWPNARPNLMALSAHWSELMEAARGTATQHREDVRKQEEARLNAESDRATAEAIARLYGAATAAG